MSEKFLNMQLLYKGKVIDVAKYKRDFKDKFYIGSDKRIFWQILNPSFPKKYLLLTKVGNNYAFSLNKSMKIEIEKDGKILSMNDLRRAKLISGNKVILSPNTTGRLRILDDWEISYKFTTPYRRVISSVERALIKKYRKYESLDSETKFTILFLILSLLVTLFGLSYFEKNYKPVPLTNKTILQELKTSTTRISKIEIPKVEEKVEKTYQPVAEGAVGERKAKTEKTAKRIVKQLNKNVNQQLKSFLGSDVNLNDVDNENANSENELYQVATLSAIKSKNSGKSLMKSRRSSSGDVADLSKEFAVNDNNDLMQSIGSLDDIADEKIDLSGEGFEEIKGNIKSEKANLKVVKITNSKQLAKIKNKYAFAKKIEESDIELNSGNPQENEISVNIYNAVNSYKSRIRSIFNEYNWKTKMYGTLEFEIFINSKGSIDYVDIKETPGSKFDKNFIADIRKEIQSWKFPVDTMVKYPFRMSFSSQ